MPDDETMMAVNARNWDARTPVHVSSDFYDLDGLRAGAERLAPFEYEELGALDGVDVTHLQCHLGTDTVCLARHGARAVGLDFSAESVRRARGIAADCGVDVRYEEGNAYDAVEVLGAESADLVYTGKGSLVWLPDLDRWAAVVVGLLRPGGALYLVEFHPLLGALADDQPDAGLLLDHDYLSGRGADYSEYAWTYTDGPALDGETGTYQWAHGLGDVVTALLRAGLRLASLVEHDVLPWQRFPGMTDAGNGWWRVPPSRPRVPVLYSLRAVRP